MGFPEAQGLYDARNEHDSCGVGFVAHIKGKRSHQILIDAEEVLRNMDHRGACGCEPNTGDGAGVSEPDLKRITSENAAKLFGFKLN